MKDEGGGDEGLLFDCIDCIVCIDCIDCTLVLSSLKVPKYPGTGR